MVCDGITGRLEVAQELVKLLELENKIKITPVSSHHFKSIYFSPRPDSERLLNKKLDLRGINIMRDWKVCLREYITSYYQSYLD